MCFDFVWYNKVMLKGVHKVLPVPVLAILVTFLLSSTVMAEDWVNINTNVHINTSLTMNIPASNVTMNLNPSNHPFDEKDFTIRVGSNNAGGFKVFATSTSSNMDLVNTTSPINTIPNLTASTSAENFPVNSWGYRITQNSTTSSGNYGAFTSSSSTPIMESATVTNGKVATLGFAAKIDYNKPAGSYKLDLNFAAVPNVTTNYMQGLDPTLCTSEPTVVIDRRDEKAYTITRLPDGNCWMTTNLDLAGGTTVTPADSNVSANYTLPASESISTGTKLANSSAFTDDNTAYVFNSNSTTCGENSPCYSYYSYAAATAGTNPSSGDATSDICPKGWKLPTQAELTTLANTYTTVVAFTAAPFNGVVNGVYSSGSFMGGDIGGYHSSRAGGSSISIKLVIDGSAIDVTDVGKGMGTGVRCVIKKPTMQNFTSADATSMATGDTATLTDSRDGNEYTVAKLPDGNVWMTKNLDLAGGTTLTPADSNVSANYTLPASDNSSTSFSDNSKDYVYNSNSTTCGDNSPCYSYYSYVAATAGASPYFSDITSDICPKGWRLPTQAELTTLKNTYTTGATLTAAPFIGVYAGYYYDGSFGDGSYGDYWSSTVSSSGAAYVLYFNSSSADVTNSLKRGGYGVRCVLETRTVSDITTMQNITSTVVNNTPDGATATLTDSRDSKTYTVAKIGDKLWMTKNLDLAGGTTLTPEKSNVSTNYTLPASETISSGTTLANSSAFSDYDTAYAFNSGSTTCSDSSPCYSYYSFAAATAGTGDSSLPIGGDAPSDICPKGWRLPTRTEYITLKNTYTTGAALTAAPFVGVYSGRYYKNTFEKGGSTGFYWSSTVDEEIGYSPYVFYFGSSYAFAGLTPKNYGFSVRCISK